jgi:hypothetical protein
MRPALQILEYCTKLQGCNGHGHGLPVALPFFCRVTVTMKSVAFEKIVTK